MGDSNAPADTGNGEGAPETGAATETETNEGAEDTTALKKALEKERTARREADKRAKALEPFEKQAKEAAEAGKTEAQKLTDALAAEKSGRTSAETELLRYRTAAEKGVPLNLVRFLAGTTAEEISESAEMLMEEIGSKPNGPAMKGLPKERRLADGKPSDASDSDDPIDLITKARAGRI